MKVLINVPRLELPGGVAHYYLVLRDYLDNQHTYFEIGARGEQESIVGSLWRMFADFWKFHRELSSSSYDLVHINPSLVVRSVIRDGIFLILAKVHGIKVVVFFRGWDPRCDALVRRYFLWLFRFVYRRADAFIVLAEEFRQKLIEFGMSVPIYKETTVVDNRLFPDTNQEESVERDSKDTFNILFLSRLEEGKGLIESIEAFDLLRQRVRPVSLTIAGDGSQRSRAEAYVSANDIDDVRFIGHVTGELKRRAFTTADVYVFPSSYGEGMPNSVLEAMAAGLPVVTSPVGGLKDFFEDGLMGFFTASNDPDVISELLYRLSENRSLREKIGVYNQRYALKHFAASVVVNRLIEIYEQVRILRSHD